MTRQELYSELVKADLLNKKDKGTLWQAAFELYKKETGDKEVAMECGMCYNKVQSWLQR